MPTIYATRTAKRASTRRTRPTVVSRLSRITCLATTTITDGNFLFTKLNRKYKFRFNCFV